MRYNATGFFAPSLVYIHAGRQVVSNGRSGVGILLHAFAVNAVNSHAGYSHATKLNAKATATIISNAHFIRCRIKALQAYGNGGYSNGIGKRFAKAVVVYGVRNGICTNSSIAVHRISNSITLGITKAPAMLGTHR